MSFTAAEIEREMSELSARLSPEATYYWECHRPRYRYFMELLQRFREGNAFRRILDVGMGFETLILARLFPDSRIDCLGLFDDDRYRPASAFTFHQVDLNEAARRPPDPAAACEPYDLIVCMEVIEHLYTPPALVMSYFARRLASGGVLLVTTPNAAWLKNRIKLLYGKHPYEMLQEDLQHMGHVREYTRKELSAAFAAAGLVALKEESRGLYRFNNVKDRLYSRFADWTLPSLRRTLVAVYRKP